MLTDLGVNVGIILCSDASAALGIASRRGLGKVRHIEVDELWLQDQVARGRIQVIKVKGDDNFADSLTKNATAERIHQTMRSGNQRVAIGRHVLMPSMAVDAS